MRNFKSVLAMIVAVCLMMCLAVPALATTVDTSDTSSSDHVVTVDPTDATGTTDATTAATGTTDATTAATDATDAAEEAIDEDDIVVEDAEEETETESGFVKVLRVILLVLEVISSVALIVVVLLQSGKEAGLSGALSGNSDSYLNKKGGSLDKVLASATKWIALAWILITLALALI